MTEPFSSVCWEVHSVKPLFGGTLLQIFPHAEDAKLFIADRKDVVVREVRTEIYDVTEAIRGQA